MSLPAIAAALIMAYLLVNVGKPMETSHRYISILRNSFSANLNEALLRSSMLALSPRGDRLATRNERTIRIWDMGTSEEIGDPITEHTRWLSPLAFSYSGDLLAVGDIEHVILWDLSTSNRFGRSSISTHINSAIALAISPDEKTLAIGSGRTVRLSDMTTNRSIGDQFSGPDWVYSLAFSPDGDLLAIGGDHTVWLWDAVTGQLIGRLIIGISGPVESLAFSPDGRILATGSGKTVSLWDVGTRQRIGEPITSGADAVASLAFDRTGSQLNIASRNTLWYWPGDPEATTTR